MAEATRLRGDARPILICAVALTSLLFLAAFAMGVPGLLDAATWARLSGWERALVPVVLDLGMLISAVASVVARARHESPVLPRISMGALAGISVAAQVVHVITATGPGEELLPRVVVGVAIAVAAPVWVLVTTEMLLSLAIAPPARRAGAKTAPAPVQTYEPVAAPVAAPIPQAAGPAAQETAPAARPAPTPEPAPAPAPALAPPKPKPTPTPAPAPSASETDREEQMARARELRAAGMSFGRISAETGIPASTLKRRLAGVGPGV